MILQTKLHRPATTPDLMCRSRLHDRLDEALIGHRALVCAPAGYGKSALVSHWAELRPEPCAWLSLDSSDSDLRVFLEYVIAAIRTVIPDACPETSDALRSSALPPVDVLAGSLINELDAIEKPFILVLDDFQRVSDAAVFELVDLLLEHTPESLCLVLVTRRDPQLAIPRLRARGQLTEIRLRDLVFDTEETEALAQQVMGVSVGTGAVANLQAVVEGWAVGIRLALLALRNESDPDRYLSEFKGGTAAIEEYLVQEVLAKQPKTVRDGLIRTALLDRFCAPLCDAVLTENRERDESVIDGRDFIQALLDGGLFTIQLDAHGEWYRYHHIFQRLLKDRLEQESDKASIATLHIRASDWFESNGLIIEAIDHALLAGDETAAAEVVERNRVATVDAEGSLELASWLDRLSPEIRSARAGLLMTEAYQAAESFDLDRLAALLDRAEPLAADSQVSIEQKTFRGVVAFWSSDAASCASDLEEVLDAIPERDSWIRGEVMLYRGLALHVSGREDEAIRFLNSGIARNGSSHALVWGRLVAGLVFLRLLRGELMQADQEAARLGDGARRAGSEYLEAWSAYLSGNAGLQRFDLLRATQRLGFAASKRSILHTRAAIDGLAGLALVCEMSGASEEADLQLERGRELARWSGVVENQSIVRSCEARLALLRGDLDEAAQWQASFHEPIDLAGAFVFMEVPWLTAFRVRALTADGTALRAVGEELKRLRNEFASIHDTGHQLEILALEALVLHRQGQTDEALGALERSLALATPGGWIRPYLELGPPMAELMARLPDEWIDSVLVRQIRSFIPSVAAATHTVPQRNNARGSGLDLTNRERDVLDLLDERLRDKEIAQKLHISPETVKTHLKTLYRKLDCRDRRGAVAKARELGVLA